MSIQPTIPTNLLLGHLLKLEARLEFQLREIRIDLFRVERLKGPD